MSKEPLKSCPTYVNSQLVTSPSTSLSLHFTRQRFTLVPSDYEEMLDFYTHHGYRVIALAAKSLPNISLKRAQRLKRQEAESELVFLGFIVFENKLKPSTPGVLAQLRDARIRRVMCTGDNILTAISVARECELVSKEGYVFVPHFKEGMIPVLIRLKF
jgi:cation-transporting P-type ATPase 13A2